jgi:DHA1 family tetracycline resistance protein-like MFS transporter
MSPRAPSRQALVFIAITLLLDTIGFGLIVPVMPALLVGLTGKPVSQAAIDAGWLAFVYATIQFLCAPVLGNLSDRFGRRPVLLIAIGALGIDYIIMGLAPTLAWLFVGRAVAGMAGASFTPAYAYVADISPPEKRAQNFGVVGAMFGLGFITGPAIGGLLGGLGPRAPFFAAAILSLLNLLYGTFVLPESLPPERRRGFHWKRANPLGTLNQMRKRPVVLGLLAALFLWMLANQVMPSTWSFYTKFRFAWSEAMIGASLAAVGVVMAVSQGFGPRVLVPRLGERGTALLGIAVAVFGYAGYGLATAGWMMFAWLAPWLVSAIVMPTTNALISHRVAADAQGELQGAVAGLYSLSSIVGPPMMTQLFGHFSATDAQPQLPGAAFFAASLLTVGCFGIFWFATTERGMPDVAADRPGQASPGATIESTGS